MDKMPDFALIAGIFLLKNSFRAGIGEKERAAFSHNCAIFMKSLPWNHG